MSSAMVIDLETARRDRRDARRPKFGGSPGAKPTMAAVAYVLLLSTLDAVPKKHRRALARRLRDTATDGAPERRLAAYQAWKLLDDAESM